MNTKVCKKAKVKDDSPWQAARTALKNVESCFPVGSLWLINDHDLLHDMGDVFTVIANNDPRGFVIILTGVGTVRSLYPGTFKVESNPQIVVRLA